MKLRLSDFEEGLAVAIEQDFDPAQLDLEFVDLKYTQPLHLAGTIEKGADTLTFRGSLLSQVEHVCGRCLKKINESLEEPFEFFYEIQGKEFIDTINDLREVLILDHPISFVCQESCGGLCPQCGINRNESRCACTPSKEFSPNVFSQLKNIWASKKGGGHG